MSKTRNQEELDVFAVKVLTCLRSCLPQRTAAFRKAQREAMWKSYSQLRTSPSFYALWKEFFTKTVAVDPHPILYQYVTNQAFEALIQETFQTSNVQYSKPQLKH